MKKLLSLLTVITVMIGIGCSSDKIDPPEEKILELKSDDKRVSIGADKQSAIILVDYEKGTINFTINSSHEWRVEEEKNHDESGWYEYKKTGDQLSINVASFIDKGDSRSAVIYVKNLADLKAKITINQTGENSAFIAFDIEGGIEFTFEGGSEQVEIITNATTLDITNLTTTGSDNADWIEASIVEIGEKYYIKTKTTASASTTERTAAIEVTATKGEFSNKATLNVKQAAAVEPTIELIPDKIQLFPQGGSVEVGITTNVLQRQLRIVKGDEEWISSIAIIDREDELFLAIKATPNTTENEREATIKIIATNSSLMEASATITVKQASLNIADLAFELTVTNISKIAFIPVYGNVTIDIDWGDSSEIEKVDALISKKDWTGKGLVGHTYAETGVYVVTIRGNVERLNSQDLVNTTNNYISKVLSWGSLRFKSLEGAFAGTKITTLPEAYDQGLFEDVSTCKGMFAGCESLTQVPQSLLKSLVNCEIIDNLFGGCINLESIPAGLFDNMTKVTSAKDIFAKCAKITEIPLGLFDNMTQVKTFNSVFYGTSIKTVSESIFNKNTLVTDFGHAFLNCFSLESVPENLFANNLEVTTFRNMFDNCKLLKSVPEGLFAKNTKVTTFESLFAYCHSLTSIPANLFANNNLVTTFTRMAIQCIALESIPDRLFAGKDKVTTFKNTFASCKSLNTVGKEVFENCILASDFNSIFSGCTALESVGDYLFKGCSASTTFYESFLECAALKSTGKGMFEGCTAVTTFYATFAKCSSLATVDVDTFKDCSAATTYHFTFADCIKLTSIPENIFSSSPNVKTFFAAFGGCTTLQTIPRGIFDNNRKAENFEKVFLSCSALTGETPYTEIEGVKVHLWERNSPDFSRVYYYSSAFQGCVDLSDWKFIPDGWKGM